ncbi:hypothetical protein HPB47_012278, partial [Ixodes persulcatus]
CVVQALPRAGNPAAVLSNVAGLLETVLGRLGITADISSISNLLCRPFGFPLLPCENFTSGTLVCGEPITVTLPSVFNIGSCILSGAPGTMGLSLARALVCPLVEILNSATREFAATLPFGFIFRAMAKVIRALTSRLLRSVVSSAEYLLLAEAAEAAPVAELRETTLPRLSKRTEAEARRGACVAYKSLEAYDYFE